MTATTMSAVPQGSIPALAAPALQLWAIFAAYRWRILVTYALFNLENLLRLAQPLVLGWAIHDLLRSSVLGLAIFFGQHVLYLAVSAGRRLYDTRCFTRIHADLATALVLDQRGREGCQRLMTVPGVGPIISSAVVAAIGNAAVRAASAS
jgi:hypothetical protein